MIILEVIYVNFIVSSADIIYSYVYLTFGIKYAIYFNKLNLVFVLINKESIFHNQCLKICDIVYKFMFIVIKYIFIKKFLT